MGPACHTCRHPKVAELHARLPAESAKSLAGELGMSLAAVYRHIRSGHHLRKPQEATQNAPGSTITPQAVHGHNLAPSISATLRAVENLARESQRHLKDARKAGDHKATNGAITAAAKALDLLGKLRGELQGAANINVSVSAEATSAIGALAAAQEVSADDVIESMLSYLAAHLQAGDAHAIAAVGALMRMLPTAQPQEVTGVIAPEIMPSAGDPAEPAS